MRRLSFFSVSILLIVPAAARASTAEELLSRIERARDLAIQASADPAPERMDAVRAALGLPDEVRIAGRSVRVEPDPYLEQLDGATSAAFQSAARHLGALADAVRSASGSTPAAEADLRADLERAYGGLQPEPGLLERIRRFLSSLWGTISRELGDGLRGWPGWAALAVLVALAVLGLRRLGVRPVPDAAAGGPESRPTAADWRRRAERARARGDLSEAVACGYRALVAALAEGGLLEDRPALTTGEVRGAAGGSRPAVMEATRRYERVRFGMAPPTDSDVAALLDADRGRAA